MRITELTLKDFRNYEHFQLDLPPGLTVLHGPVGAGKTNLIEALYFACTGRSCRTSDERQLVRFGQSATRVTIATMLDGLERRFEVALELRPQRTKSIRADGERVESFAELEGRPLVCVFLPDRMELVKGPAGARRGHLDSFVAALWPARAQTRRSYRRALAQRNVLLRSIRAGVASRESITGWDRELARAGVELIKDRLEAVDRLIPLFEARAGELGLPDPAALEYRPGFAAITTEHLQSELQRTLESDLARAFTGTGPHRDDLRLEAGGRNLRHFGSQGQQRLGLLALLLAERDCLSEQRGTPPLLLLDDVLSELDDERRDLLAQAVAGDGQTLVSTADESAATALDADVTHLRVLEGSLTG